MMMKAIWWWTYFNHPGSPPCFYNTKQLPSNGISIICYKMLNLIISEGFWGLDTVTRWWQGCQGGERLGGDSACIPCAQWALCTACTVHDAHHHHSKTAPFQSSEQRNMKFHCRMQNTQLCLCVRVYVCTYMCTRVRVNICTYMYICTRHITVKFRACTVYTTCSAGYFTKVLK